MKRVLIIAGGTGGHIFPGLELANALTQQGIAVHWLGSHEGLERQLVAPHYPISYLSVSKVRRSGWKAKCLAPFKITHALLQSLRVIRQVAPDAVVAMGGFVSGPGGLAAWLLRKPLIIHEQNSIAGITNRVLARLADAVLTAFPQAFPNRVKTFNIGNPVRRSLHQQAGPKERYRDRNGSLRLLILGGSQGALAINRVVSEAIQHYAQVDRLAVWHQAGKGKTALVEAAYQNLPMEVRVVAFIEDMVAAYNWADLVIARAGALTVSEIAAIGVASILIPFPYAVDNHQMHNAKYLEQAGAAIIVAEQDLTIARLHGVFDQYIEHRSLLEEMAICAKSLAKPEAVSLFIEQIAMKNVT